jgi:hypothetical protein
VCAPASLWTCTSSHGTLGDTQTRPGVPRDHVLPARGPRADASRNGNARVRQGGGARRWRWRATWRRRSACRSSAWPAASRPTGTPGPAVLHMCTVLRRGCVGAQRGASARVRAGPARMVCACGPSEDGVRVRARRGAVDASLLAGGAASSACSFARPMEIETRSQYAQVYVECLLFCPAQVECSSARLGVWRC